MPWCSNSLWVYPLAPTFGLCLLKCLLEINVEVRETRPIDGFNVMSQTCVKTPRESFHTPACYEEVTAAKTSWNYAVAVLTKSTDIESCQSHCLCSLQIVVRCSWQLQ